MASQFTLATDLLKQNLCPWCFGIGWRLQDDDSNLHRLISKRWESISRHLAHASWKEARLPRQFHVEKIVNVVDALDRFANALSQGDDDQKRLGEDLAAEIQRARAVTARGVTNRTTATI